MGFCSDHDYEIFLRQAPMFEEMLIESGFSLTKLWFSITQAEQRTRFAIRQIDPVRRWKLSPMDIESLDRWDAYTAAKEAIRRLSRRSPDRATRPGRHQGLTAWSAGGPGQAGPGQRRSIDDMGAEPNGEITDAAAVSALRRATGRFQYDARLPELIRVLSAGEPTVC